MARPIAVPVHVSNGAAADIRGRICVEASLFAHQEGTTECHCFSSQVPVHVLVIVRRPLSSGRLLEAKDPEISNSWSSTVGWCKAIEQHGLAITASDPA